MANLLQSILSLFAVVLVPLNVFGGIISGIWLAALGEWSLIAYGIGTDIFGSFFLAIPLLLTTALSIPGQALIEKRKKFAGMLFALLSLLVTYSIIALWCLGVLFVFLGHRTASNSFPLLLWIFSTATGPWTYMASREGNNHGASISLLSTHLAMLGAVTTYWICESSFTAALAFLSFLGIGFVIHLAVALSLIARSRTSPLEEPPESGFEDYSDGTTVVDISTVIKDQGSSKRTSTHEDAKVQAETCLRYYFHREGSAQDGSEALNWLHRAAEQGHADAQHNLATFYTIGCGVAQDETEAAKWCRKAAEQGLAEAQSTLGLLYQTGQGVPKNYAEAYFWAFLAATAGAKDSLDLCNRIAGLLTPQQISNIQRRAREWKPALPLTTMPGG